MTAARTGVYICHCGTNIAGMVDVAAVRDWALENLADKGVVVARDYPFMCSSLGQELIEKDIKEHGLERIVVGACSPHMHEKTFREASSNAGLNPYLTELVSIREQVSWVHTDKAKATEKAKAIIAGGVYRVQEQEPLERLMAPVNPATLIVGGGIAGITAALELADAGYPVHIVEREPSIGGHMAQYDKTFPTLDCAACILTPKMVDAGAHKNITLHTWSEVTDVSGSVGDFKITVKHKPRMLVEKDCTGCGICIEKCPVQVIDTGFEAGIGYRKAIYTPFPQSVPKYPVLTPDDCTYFAKGTCKACEKFCPTNCIDFTQTDQYVELNVGNILIATGFAPFDARRIEAFGYGRLPNVFTSMEFERMSNAAGPTGGRIVLRDGVTEPRSVAILHCVGSRDKNTNEYCSAICCMQSLKFAHLVKEHTDADVYECYIDMRTPGKGYDEFYNRILNEGTQFIRGRVAEDLRCSALPGGGRPRGPHHRPGGGHAGRSHAARAGGYGHPLGRPGAAAGRRRGGAHVRHRLQQQGLHHRAPRQAGAGGHHDRRRLRCRSHAGAAGHPHERLERGGGGGADPEPHLAGSDRHGAVSGDGGHGPLLRLPHLQ